MMSPLVAMLKRLTVVCTLLCFAASPVFAQADVYVINMIPKFMSGETAQDGEPNIAVNPSNTMQMVATAFTPNPTGALNLAPVFISIDGGLMWTVNNIVPSGNGMTGDITVSFADRGNTLYAGILRGGAFLNLRILRTADPFFGPAMTTLVINPVQDQPYVEAATTDPGGGDVDRVYVGLNDYGLRISGGGSGRTATEEFSLDARTAAAPAGFNPTVIEDRATFEQDMPAIRTAIHPNGTIYSVFYRWTAGNTPNAVCDVIVVRDDNWGAGATPFTDLQGSDGNSGVRVVTGVTVPAFPANLGSNRLVASNLSIAVNPNDSTEVWMAWADNNGSSYTLHVRRSTDSGATWSPADVKTVNNATNPALAINNAGKVGFLYQQLTGPVAARVWETHFETTTDSGASWADLVLARTSDSVPAFSFFLGDYVEVMAVGETFFGVFSASNVPNNANFPNGVTYQRNANFTTNTLLDVDGVTPVAVSIDPFFFRVAEPFAPQIQVPGGVALGDICVGSTSTATLDVCNTGKDDLIVDPIASSDPQFSVNAPSSGYPVTISPDFCFPFQVEFAPAATGPQSATLTILSNDPDSPSTAVAVSGAGTEPDIRVTGSTDFGVPSAWTPAEKALSVCNTGGCDLSVTAAAVGCADFTLVHNPFPATLSPGSCLDLVVRFTPVLPGAKSCNLTVASDDPDTPSANRTLTARTPPLFSLHAGLVDPHGALNAVTRQGSTVNLDFVYPFTPNWAWDVRLGYSSFDGRPALPDVDLLNLSANARFTVNPPGVVRFFLNGGLGLYHFDPGDFEGGGNLGLGLNVPVGPHFEFEATYNYHSAFTANPNLEFGQVQLGFLVSF